LIAAALHSGGASNPADIEFAALALVNERGQSEARAEAILDAARFFYVTGRPEIGLRVAESAKGYAIETAQLQATVSACILVGVCAADTGDLPRAMEAYADGLNIAQRSGDRVREAKLWQNTGVALSYGGLFREATACYHKVLSIVQADGLSQSLSYTAFGGIALCALNLEDPGLGIAAVTKGIAAAPAISDAHSVQNRVLMENYYTRLLIEINDFDGALSHARTAREYANKSKSPRSDIQASVAEGLAEAFSGNLDVGISRLTATLERAKTLNLASREVLVALVKALEYAGRHDEALKYLQEMLSAQRKTAEANVLHHVHQHLIQLHASDANSPLEDIRQVMRRMETRVEVVEGRVAKVELIKQRQELFKARIEAMERLAVAAELRDDSTGEHSYRVGRMACLLAKEAGCDDETIFMIDIAARLHDIGKIGIPDGILLKPRGLKPAERLVMEMHAEIGADVLAKSEIPHIKMAEEIARHHHERWDGKGYPAKIGCREIPFAARITALADVYDALTHERVYKKAWMVELTLSEIVDSRGTHFDPELTDLFVALVSRLHREHRDLDHFLGEAARASPFIQARSKIWDTLKLAREEYQLEFQRSMDLQR
jgi:putative two-component system response regulator